MDLNLSWRLFSNPTTVLTTMFGNTPHSLQQPWNQELLNIIWIIQALYGFLMIGSGVDGLAALKTSLISDGTKDEFKVLVPRHPCPSADTEMNKDRSD